MAHCGKNQLTTPAWLLGPGLAVPPIFLVLIVCVWPRPTPPSVPAAFMPPAVADRHLEEVSRRVAAFELNDREQSLRETWRTLQASRLEARAGGDGADGEAIAETEQEMRRGCRRVFDAGGIERLFLLGDKTALELTRAMERMAAPQEPERAENAARELGGGVLLSARRSGLVDEQGRLRAHPMVPFALAQVAWRSECGLRLEAAMEPVELDAVDVYRISFGRGLPAKQRFDSVERFSRRHGDYPADRARAALWLEAGDQARAMLVLNKAAARNPGDFALRNYGLYAQRLGQD